MMMSNTAANPEAVARKTKSGTMRRLLQAVALAAIVIPLGSVAVETASVTCRFNNTGYGSFGGTYCNGQEGEGDEFFATQNTSRFDFGDYFLELQFLLAPDADFDVRVETTPMTNGVEGGFAQRAGELDEEYDCIALTEGGPCVNFEVIPNVPREGNWISYEIEINWNKTSESYDRDLMRILHDFGDDSDNIYDEDMCATALNDSSYLPCDIDPDPRIRSGDTDFQNFTAALASTPLTPVPEPSSLILLGAGISGVLMRRRRRQ
jgi:hypothetical protein